LYDPALWVPRVLRLNATVEPLAVVTAKRAIVVVLAGKAECIEATVPGLVPDRRAMPMTRRRAAPRGGRRASCDKRHDRHVLPRSRGSRSWAGVWPVPAAPESSRWGLVLAVEPLPAWEPWLGVAA
jgi:hypothetical protein